jgi:hypothetical protein
MTNSRVVALKKSTYCYPTEAKEEESISPSIGKVRAK